MFIYITSLATIISIVLAVVYYYNSRFLLAQLIKEEKKSHELKERLEDVRREKQELAGRIPMLEWELRDARAFESERTKALKERLVAAWRENQELEGRIEIARKVADNTTH